MFTGLIETVGLLTRIEPASGGAQLEIYAPDFGRDLAIGDSVAVNGSCLTIVKFDRGGFVADVSSETLDKTAVRSLRTGSKVNLERAMRLSDRMGGHMVSGHVDGVGELVQRHVSGNATAYQFEIPEELAPYVVDKGSIAIDGISLTVARLKGNMVALAVIPHTEASTTLGEMAIGTPVNIEVDLIGKYVYRAVAAYMGEDSTAAAADDSRLRDKFRNFMEG